MARIDPNLRIRSVELAVSDLQRSVEFYERTLGLPLITQADHTAQLGPDGERPALVLSEIAGETTRLPPGASGLYHVAWLHPSRAALAQTVRRIVAGRWMLEGASDHGVSEALYLSDPDGLGIEIYADRPRGRWPRPPDGHGVQMGTLPLDLDDLLAQSASAPEPTIAPETFVGHVHLKVADLERTAGFYRDALGFDEQARLPSAAFLSAGGYHHHIGLNSWQSRGARLAPESAPGLRDVAFELGGEDAIVAVAHDVTQAAPEVTVRRGGDGHLHVRDPDGESLTFM